ncbi:MAG: hypothetical protein K1X64_08640 [Myxococcaceae bacterium]|nr:hypothetical protein [Myxococcaceae bacterium]
MNLLGKDISSEALLTRIGEKLLARGLASPANGPIRFEGVEPRVDPLAFNLEAMAEHADVTRPLPLESHRQGLGRAVLWSKRVFRATCQVLINETLGRQRVFNGHVRDAYAQLSAEVVALRAQVEALQNQAAASVPAPVAAKTPRKKR